MRIYCGIDGTDNEDTSADPIMCVPLTQMVNIQAGHVKRLEHFGFTRSKYFAGTKDRITGDSSEQIVANAFNWVKAAYNASLASTAETKVYLSGFSRGGAAALVVGHLLENENIPVQEMYLFDAVDRSTSMNNSLTRAPSKNVVRAFHAMRDAKAKSRGSFGNCGNANTNGNLIMRRYMTTHGGGGGWPNGKAMVKPGFGPEDFGHFPMAMNNLAATTAKLALDPAQQNIHESGAPFPTGISPEQEVRGMNLAWNWMASNVFSTEHGRAGL